MALALVVGCGSEGGGGTGGSGGTGGAGGGGGTPATPTAHTLASNQGEVIATNTMVTIGPFTVPANATVDYTILDTPTGVGNDTIDVGVATAASASTSSPVAYGIMQNVSTTTGVTPPLPAGSYDLLVQCANLVDNCVFQVTLTATY
jgi:hypothetical protein